MTRLRDQTGQDPTPDEGILLLRGLSGTAPDAEMRQRVWAAVASSETRPLAGFRRWRFSVVATAAVVLFVAGTAGAVIARRFITPIFHRGTVTEPAQAPPVAPTRKTLLSRSTHGAETMIAAADPTPSKRDSTAPPAAVRPSANRGTRRVSAAVSERLSGRSSAPDSAALPSPRERAEVLDAMIALRRDHDADRAGHLLDRYLAARPHGALREEALALAIEAADARGDRAGVSHWARTYQNDYPTGRFAGFARSQLNTP